MEKRRGEKIEKKEGKERKKNIHSFTCSGVLMNFSQACPRGQNPLNGRI